MNFRELKERDKKIEPSLQYKLSHQGVAVFLAAEAFLLITAFVLLSVDEKRFMVIGIILFSLAFLLCVPMLIAMRVVRNKVLTSPEIKDGAEHPARILISAVKYNTLRRRIASTVLEKGRLDAYRFFMADQLMNGDLQPAEVVSVKPFVIAVYAKAFDGVLLLSFPDQLAEESALKPGQQLAATACYFAEPFSGQGVGVDIFPGPENRVNWKDLLPIIPLFLCSDEKLLDLKIYEIPKETWARASMRIREYVDRHDAVVRDGFWFTHPSQDDWDRNPIAEAER